MISKFKLRPHTIIFCISLITIIILVKTSNIDLYPPANENHFKSLGVYGAPICKIDYTWFKGETCEKCGESIMNTGAVRPYIEDKEVENFSSLYKSYKDYNNAKKKLLIPCFIIIFFIIIIVLDIIHFLGMKIYKKLRGGKENK